MTALTPIAQVQAALTYALKLEAGATPGEWEVEDCEGELSVRAGTALTKWNAERTIGTPAGSWHSTDLIYEHEIESWDDDEGNSDDNQRRVDAEQIVAGHNLWSVAFIAPLEAAIKDYATVTTFGPSSDAAWELIWSARHPHAISLAVALLAQKNGEQ